MRTGIGLGRRLAAIVILAVTTLCCALIPAAQPAAAAPRFVPINGGGSTWSQNAFEDWTASTGVQQFGMTVNYAPVGSSNGRTQFKNGTYDFGASEIPYGVRDGNNFDPPPDRGYAYMPDTAGGTTFMYNLKIGNTRVTNLRLSGKAIAGIFTGVITKWNDPIIRHDNPGLNMPNLAITPVVRSDGSGATAEFTQWMLAMEPSYWKAYCARPQVHRQPCTQTSTYPTLPPNISTMVAQAGDNGISGYVRQPFADGAIGYVEYSFAKLTGFPVAKVLNAAGYYTEPTAGHVAVSLLKAQVKGCNPTTHVCSNPNNDPLYLTQDLSGVYTDQDPRTYELSSYSYMILPTDLKATQFNNLKGFTLGRFGMYLLCQGQVPLDNLGYSSLPINLVEAGFQQLQKIPGNDVPPQTLTQIQHCNNPTFSTNGTNTLAEHDPNPPSCDKQGTTQCTSGTGGAKQSTPVKQTALGGQSQSGNGGTSGPNGTSSTGTSGSGGSVPQNCSPDQGNCNQANTASSALGNNANAVPTSAAVSLGDGLKVALMALASALLLCLVVLPPVITEASRRRRQRRGPGGMPGVLP